MPKTEDKKVSNPFFRFKRFTIFQDLCAMKVGTDGVLLGAWVDLRDARNILDVGSGTGLLSLMCAQRNPEASVTAIDLSDSAYRQTVVNIQNSVFRNRISACCTSVQKFAEENIAQFDVIVCNPPFFVDSLRSPDAKRSMARHADTLSLEDLFAAFYRLLSHNGKVSLIYPAPNEDLVLKQACRFDFFLNRKTNIIPTPDKKPKRVLFEFQRKKNRHPFCDSLVVEESRHVYSKQFRNLVREFYLYL